MYLPCLLLLLYLTVAHLSKDEIETILREKYDELHDAMCVNPASMARKLYAKYFLTKQTLQMVTSIETTTTKEAKADALMQGSQAFIQSHESPAEMFAVFLGILEKTGGASHNVAVSVLEVL